MFALKKMNEMNIKHLEALFANRFNSFDNWKHTTTMYKHDQTRIVYILYQTTSYTFLH